MASTVELMHLCRLCLVKEQVNVPIFEDQDEDSQIFMKIVTCLPVKINKDDKLPKKICGGCSYKLDLFYQFCNSTTNAEKQLLQWFNKVGFDDADNVDSQPEASKDIVDEAQADSISTETQSYILQQQQLPYGPVEFFQDDFDDSQPASGASESELVEESAVKKRKRATKNVSNKKSKTVVTTKTDASDDDDDEDDDDVNDPNVMTFEDSKFSISCDRDVEEAGPSGIGKPDAPLPDPTLDLYKKYESIYGLRKCVVLLGDIENIDSKKYSLVKTKRKKQQVSLNHVNIIDNPRTKYKCADCNERFQDYQILQSHKDVCLNKNDDEEEEEDKDDHSDYAYKYHKRLRSSTLSTSKVANTATSSEEVITTNTTTTTSEATTTNTITSSEATTTVVTSPTDESNNQDADFDQNKSYLCKCGKNFYKTCMYIAHTKLCRVYAMAKNTDHFQCKNCHRFIYSLQFHNHTCAPAPKWNCHDCDENFKSFNELVQHYKDYKHSMTCGTCLKECTSYGSLAAHKMSCNPKFAAKITKAVTSTTTTTTNTTGTTLSTTQSSCKTVKVQQATQIPAETKTTTSNKTKINSTGKTKTCKICNVILPSDEKLKKHTCVAPSTAATTTTTKCDLCSVRLPPEALISHIESHFSIVQVKNVTGSTSTEMKAQESSAEPKASDNNNVELMLSELNKIISDTKNQKCWKCTICNKIETTEKKLQEHLEQHITVHQKPNHDHSAHPPTSTTKVVKPSEILPKTVDVTTKNSTNQIPLQRMIPLMNNQNPPKLFLIMTPTGGTSSVTPVYTTMTNLNLMTQSLSTFAIQPQLNLNTTHTTAQMPIRMQITPSSVKQPIANSISNFVISDVTSGPAAQSMIEQQSPAIAVPPVEGAVSSGAPAIGDSIDAAAVSNNIDDDTATKNVDETIDDGLTENAIDVSSNPNYKPKIFVKPLSQLLKSPVKTLVNEALSSESQKQNVDGSQVKKIIDTDAGTVIKKNVAEAEKTVTNVVLAEPGKLEAIGSASSVKTIIEVVSPSTSMLPNISLVKTKGVKKFFKCSMCNILQRKSYQLKQHQKKYNCRVCPYYCCKQAMMDKHYIDVHNYKNRCALCDMQFDTIKDQKLHKRKVHWCSLCGRCFADLELHEKAYTCKSCQFTACNNVILDKHYKKMHCVTMRCTPCNEVFYSHTTFTDHKDAIHYCKKCKTYKMDLNIHQTFCKGVPIRPSPPVLNTPQVILNSPTVITENPTDVIEVEDSD